MGGVGVGARASLLRWRSPPLAAPRRHVVALTALDGTAATHGLAAVALEMAAPALGTGEGGRARLRIHGVVVGGGGGVHGEARVAEMGGRPWSPVGVVGSHAGSRAVRQVAGSGARAGEDGDGGRGCVRGLLGVVCGLRGRARRGRAAFPIARANRSANSRPISGRLEHDSTRGLPAHEATAGSLLGVQRQNWAYCTGAFEQCSCFFDSAIACLVALPL